MPTRRRRTRRRHKTRKREPWAGWSKQQPRGHQRTVMYKKCGKKCFLGPPKRPHPSFPICTKGTCRVNTKGVYAAFVRAKEWGNKRSSYKGKARPTMKRRVYTRVARKANIYFKTTATPNAEERRTRRGGKKCLRGQRRNKSGKITKHGHYDKC